MKFRASLPVVLAIATLASPTGAGCAHAPVESPLRAHAHAHTAKGEHARAYADLRAALHHELPPRDSRHALARAEAADALEHWYAGRLDEARALAQNGKPLAALELLQRLARDGLGRMPWDDRERTHGAVLTPPIPEALRRARSAEAAAIIDKLLAEARARRAAGALDEAIIRAEAIEAIAPNEPRATTFLREVASAAAAKHEALAAARTASGHPEAALLHRALANRYRTGLGEVPPILTRIVFVQPPRCAFGAANPSIEDDPTTIGIPFEVTLVGERCDVTHRPGSVVKESYRHRALVEKDVQVGQTCSTTAGTSSTSYGCHRRSTPIRVVVTGRRVALATHLLAGEHAARRTSGLDDGRRTPERRRSRTVCRRSERVARSWARAQLQSIRYTRPHAPRRAARRGRW